MEVSIHVFTVTVCQCEQTVNMLNVEDLKEVRCIDMSILNNNLYKANNTNV